MFDPELGTTTWISWSWSMPEACAIANELPRTERQFDLVFDWVLRIIRLVIGVFSGNNILALRIMRPRADFDKKAARG